MRKFLFPIIILFWIFSLSVRAADISGTWALKMKGLDGDEEFEIVIKANGEKLKVTAQHPMFEEMSGNGRLKGETIKFKLEAKNGMPMSIEFKGTVTGNKMSGTREFSMDGGPGGVGGPPGPPGGFGDMEDSEIPKEWTAEKQ
jgi:hypothetical protein